MQPYYFAWYGFFEQFKLADIYVFYDDVQYIKRSLMNRVTIRTKDGDRWMTIPVKKVNQGALINEIRCDEEHNWIEDHLNILWQSYKNTPYFNDMYEIALSVLKNSSNKLVDITINAINKVVEYYELNITTQVYKSSELNIEGEGTQRLINISSALNANVYLTGMGALRYMDFNLFDKEGIIVEFINYAKTPYKQYYHGFNPYVSILDLIANIGKCGTEYMTSDTMHYSEFVNTSVAQEYIMKKRT